MAAWNYLKKNTELKDSPCRQSDMAFYTVYGVAVMYFLRSTVTDIRV